MNALSARKVASFVRQRCGTRIGKNAVSLTHGYGVTNSRAHNISLADLQSFREALSVLQRQVENLDQLKARHYEEIIEHEEEVWDVVQGKVPQ